MIGSDFFRRYGFRVLLVIVFMLPFVWMGTKRTIMSNSNNVADWLPDNFVETKEYQWFLSHFPFERFVVVSWKGCDMSDERLEFFARKLVPEQTIDNMDTWAAGMIRADLEPGKTPESVLPDADLQGVSGTATAPSTAQQPEYRKYFKSVLTGQRLVKMLTMLYSEESGSRVTMTHEEIMQKLQGIIVGPDGKNTALIVTLTNVPQGKELAKVLEAIREIGRECGVHPEKKIDNRPILVRAFSVFTSGVAEMFTGRTPEMNGVIIGGPPVDNVAITYEGEYTLFRLAGVCGVIGLFLAWLCFRDIRLTMFVFWISILSAGMALATVSLTGGSCDAILLSMPALIYVLAMSGAVHIINYYHDAIHEKGLLGAPERAIGHAWSPCFYANFTTALGLLSLYASHLIPITKFGLYSAIGVMVQLALLFYYLPTLLYFYPSKKVAAQVGVIDESNTTMQRVWRVWGNFMIRHSTAVIVICFVTMVLFAYGMTQIKTSVKMMRFFSRDSEIIHHYTWLEEHLGPLVPMEVVIKFDNSQCKFNTLDRLRFIAAISKGLKEKLPQEVGGVMSADTMLPNFPAVEGKLAGRQAGFNAIANGMIDRRRPEMKDFVVVEGNPSFQKDDPNYVKTLQQIGITEQDAEQLRAAGLYTLKEVRALPKGSARFNLTADQVTGYQEKMQRWEKDYGTDLWRISMRVWSLKRDIDYSLFIQNVKGVVDPLVAELNAKKFPKLPDDAPRPVSAVYTGMVPVVYKTQHELIVGLRDSFLSSFVMIGLTMAFILRSPIAGFAAMIPNVFPTIVVFGFMGVFGFLVDVGTMMTASVALGISVDDTIHFLTWFRDGINNGMSRADATRYAYSRCATSMFQTTLIGGLGLSAFALSTFTPTQMFGVMMLAILSAALFGDIVFLAALLNSPLGIFFEPRKKKAEASGQEAEQQFIAVHDPLAVTGVGTEAERNADALRRVV